MIITNANGIIGVALLVMLLIAIPVDPRKDAMSKWLYWLIGPMVSATLFAIAFYSSMKNPQTSDLIGAVAAGAVFSYLGFGGAYLRKLWRPGR
ncbi:MULTISPECIES: hypothetical protein [Mycolicibacter]|uniref:hypothetical protein n=1 Tax=Mycolicibacter TaxID=1073531 RepID=UPI00061AFD24|nr:MULTISPECIES: hypothetical protein [Mycobacteriaceae]OBJ34279.1 hypothetical protein A5631_04405 [Mycolicibacter heraklionensis]ULP48518.1 hypothetical protein MJO54_05185 [Mycolicibacter virginiensis]